MIGINGGEHRAAKLTSRERGCGGAGSAGRKLTCSSLLMRFCAMLAKTKKCGEYPLSLLKAVKGESTEMGEGATR